MLPVVPDRMLGHFNTFSRGRAAEGSDGPFVVTLPLVSGVTPIVRVVDTRGTASVGGIEIKFQPHVANLQRATANGRPQGGSPRDHPEVRPLIAFHEEHEARGLRLTCTDEGTDRGV